MNQQQLGATLQQLRQKHKISQEELSERIKVSRQAISKWERGEATPDIYNLKALSDLYGVTIDDIVSNNLTHSNLMVQENSQKVTQPILEKEVVEETKEESKNIVVKKEKRKLTLFPLITFLSLFFSALFYSVTLSNGGEGFAILGFMLLIVAIIYFGLLFSKDHYAYASTNLTLKILSIVFIFIAMLISFLIWVLVLYPIASLFSIMLLILPAIISLTHFKYLYINKLVLIIFSLLFLLVDLMLIIILFSGSGMIDYILFLSSTVLGIALPASIIISELVKSQKPASKFVLDIISIVLLSLKALIILIALGSSIPAWLFITISVITTFVVIADHILSLVFTYKKDTL